MNWIKDFFTPLFQITFIFGLLALFSIILGRALTKLWGKKWKFKLKYTFKKYNEDDIKNIMFMSETESRATLEMKLLVEELKKERINELLYIYDMFQRKKVDQYKKELKEKSKEKKQRRNKNGR